MTSGVKFEEDQQQPQQNHRQRHHGCGHRAEAALALAVGVICLICWLARLVFLANLVSNPVLIGYMAGIAVLVIVSQLGTVSGIDAEGDSVLSELLYVTAHLDLVHRPSLLVAAGTFALLVAFHRLLPRWPGPLIAMAMAAAAVAVLDLDQMGVATVGGIPRGLPPASIPDFSGLDLGLLLQLRSVWATTSLNSAHLAAAPGTQFNYHNPNYHVAAHLVEVLSGETFETTSGDTSSGPPACPPVSPPTPTTEPFRVWPTDMWSPTGSRSRRQHPAKCLTGGCDFSVGLPSPNGSSAGSTSTAPMRFRSSSRSSSWPKPSPATPPSPPGTAVPPNWPSCERP